MYGYILVIFCVSLIIVCYFTFIGMHVTISSRKGYIYCAYLLLMKFGSLIRWFMEIGLKYIVDEMVLLHFQ